MDLPALQIFVCVAERGSFTQAAEQLGLTRSRVSAAVQQLEARLGTRLLHRTTRRVRLTADGEECLERAQDLLADAEQLFGRFRPVAGGLRGAVRIDVPGALARDLLIPALPAFLERHPLLEVGLSTTDQRVDLVREGFDAVLRVGPLADSTLVARPLGWMPVHNVASPAYLQRHGVPQGLDDLASHRVVHYAARLGTQGAGWEYMADGQVKVWPMRASVVVNGTDAYQAACLAGLGLIQAPERGTRALVAAGALVEVLPAYRPAPMPVTLLYPHRRHLAPRVQAVLQWIAEVVQPQLAPAP